MTFALAHLSDLHLPIPPGALRPWSLLAGKRLLAYLAWRRKRHRLVDPAPLLADLAAARPDHIVVTGDLVNCALPMEFAAAAAWLACLGPPTDVTVVPGNHDATASLGWDQGLAHWRRFATDRPGTGLCFPTTRDRGAVTLLGLSSAVATLPLLAGGRIGDAQLAALPDLLDAAARAGRARVVLVHHPPLPGPGGWRKALWDRSALGAVLRRHGAELVLHGHHHRVMRGALPGPRGPIPVLGAPQALRYATFRHDAGRHDAGRRRNADPADGRRNAAAPAWCLHRIAREPGRWRIETSIRRLQDGDYGAVGSETIWVSSADGS